MNAYILTWQMVTKNLITAHKCIYESNKTEYTLSQEINDIRELASKQLKILDETRPNKEKSMYSQASKEQKEFIDYLESVIIYGNLDAKDKTK